MPSPARSTFLQGVAAFRATLDEPLVLNPTAEGDFLRKGATVAAFNLLESFVLERTEELASVINAGPLQFLDFPDTFQRTAIEKAVKVGASQLKWARYDLPDLRTFSGALGMSLGSVGRNLNLSALGWQWEGSNMSMEDLQKTLRHYHVKKPWVSADEMYERCTGRSLGLKGLFVQLALERNRCAHIGGHGVTTLWLRTVPETILAIALSFDLLAATSAAKFRDGDRVHLANEESVDPSAICLRFIQERQSGWAVIAEGARRASKTGNDPDALLAAASSAAKVGEAVIKRELSSDVIDWSVGTID